jgi:hypothetical protein
MWNLLFSSCDFLTCCLEHRVGFRRNFAARMAKAPFHFAGFRLGTPPALFTG